MRSETAAVADINRDGRLDIVSGEYLVPGPLLDQAPLPRGWLLGQLHRQLQRPARRCRRRRLSSTSLTSRGSRDAYCVVAESWSVDAAGSLWTQADVNACCNVEFAVLADLNNDGKVQEVSRRKTARDSPGTRRETAQWVRARRVRPHVWTRHWLRRRERRWAQRHSDATRLARSAGRPHAARVGVPRRVGIAQRAHRCRPAARCRRPRARSSAGASRSTAPHSRVCSSWASCTLWT